MLSWLIWLAPSETALPERFPAVASLLPVRFRQDNLSGVDSHRSGLNGTQGGGSSASGQRSPNEKASSFLGHHGGLKRGLD